MTDIKDIDFDLLIGLIRSYLADVYSFKQTGGKYPNKDLNRVKKAEKILLLLEKQVAGMKPNKWYQFWK